MFTLGRPVDPRHPTNLALLIVLAAVLAGVVIVRLTAGAALLDGLYGSLRATLAVFLAWALAREIDPDHPLSAFVATALALPAALLLPPAVLLLSFLLLLPLRTVNRTVGLPARPADAAVTLGLVWFVWQGYLWVGVTLAGAFLFDGLLSAPNRRRIGLAGVPVGVGAWTWIVHGGSAPGAPHGAWLAGTAAAAVVFLPVVAGSSRVTSVGDVTGEPLDPRRVQAAQALALLAGVGTAVVGGEAGVSALLPLWSALAGTGLYRVSLLACR